MDIATLEKEVLSLDPRARGRLASKLLQSLDDDSLEEFSEDENQRIWAEEAERRNDEMESGEIVGIPIDDVLSDARSLLK